MFDKENITPKMVGKLFSSLEKQEQILRQKDQQIDELLMLIHQLRQKQFGRSSEAFNPDQLQIFDETQLDEWLKPDESDEQVTALETTVKPPKQKPRRRPLPATYRRVETIIDLPDDEKAQMGSDWVFIGYDSSEQLSVTPRQHFVIVTKPARYAPVNDHVKGAEQGIRAQARPDHSQVDCAQQRDCRCTGQQVY